MATEAGIMARAGELDEDVTRTEMLDVMSTYLYPVLRLAVALGVVWFASSVSS